MYSTPSIVIAGCLFLAMFSAMLLGARFAKRLQRNEDDDAKAQANAVQASLLGLLALLLGFTFSLSLERHDQRSLAVVEEAKAIEAARYRLDLLDEEQRGPLLAAFRTYCDERLVASQIPTSDEESWNEALEKVRVDYKLLWEQTVDAVRPAPSASNNAMVSAILKVRDTFTTRLAAANRHVPPLVVGLLFTTFIILGGVIGFASAVSGVRPGLPIFAMMSLITILVFLILDLDRPRRGLVEVDQTPLISVVESITSRE